jgi:hypothetical protein
MSVRNIPTSFSHRSEKEVFMQKEEDKNKPERELKTNYTVYLYPSIKDMIDNHLSAADKRSRSDFIEAAVKFYCGVLDSETDKQFLGEQIISTMKAIMDEFSGNVFAHLRAQDVAVTSINQILATGLANMTPQEIESLRRSALEYVSKNMKSKSFISAVWDEKKALENAETDT